MKYLLNYFYNYFPKNRIYQRKLKSRNKHKGIHLFYGNKTTNKRDKLKISEANNNLKKLPEFKSS